MGNVLKRAQKKTILLREVSFENSETGTFYWEKNNFQFDLEDHNLILILKITIFGDHQSW